MNPVKREVVFDVHLSEGGSNTSGVAETKRPHGEGIPSSVVDISCSTRMGVSFEKEYASTCPNQFGCGG
jgi:hypothetical protein